MKRIIISLVLLGACQEYFTEAENKDAAPTAVEIILRDGVEGTALNAAEGGVMFAPWTEGSAIFPFQYPRILFNKLLDGDTIEQVEEDLLTKRALGNCLLVDGDPLTIEVGGDTLPGNQVWACYSPSDKSLEVRPLEGDAPAGFLPYGQNYIINLTSKITDKDGRGLAAKTYTIPVRPFEVLTVAAASPNSLRLFGAAGSGLEPEEVPTLSVGSQSYRLRIVFSGPMDGTFDTAKVFHRSGPNNGLEVSSGGQSGTAETSRVSTTTKAGAKVSPDPRVVFVFSPQFITSAGKAGYPAGDYELVLPGADGPSGATGAIKDANGVPLPSTVSVPFTVAPAAAR